MKVIVIGAGLGGLTLAQGLKRAGIEVAVYERDDEKGRPQGVSLHFDDRGAAALHACLPPKQVAMAEATMGRPRDRTLLLNGELAVIGERLSDGTVVRPGRQASRRLLRAVLLTGLDVRFGAKFEHYEQQPDGTVRAHFANGHKDVADVLVGADGVGSAVRRQRLPDVRVIDTGKRMLMGATPLRAVADQELLDRIGDNAAAVRVGDTMMALGVHRFAEPLAEDYVMWALSVTQEQVESCTARELAPHPTLRSIVDAAWPQLTVPIRIGMIPPVTPWPASPVTVIGDAIHAAPGFGGNLAMQDAQRLRDALLRAANGEQDLVTAIGASEHEMRT